jgi:sterol desaturase/sphingolipid hydroxylase (fatty acid hydroxylase superfamily)
MKRYLQEWLDFALFPAVSVALLGADAQAFQANPYSRLALVALGLGLWTAAEYALHRWLLHWVYWDFHREHHDSPHAPTLFPLWYTPLIFAGIACVLTLVFGRAAPPVIAGFVFGYVWMITVHWILHHAPEYMQTAALEHNAHHRLTNVNYGIITTVWDRAFGTYMPRGRGRVETYGTEPMEHL